MRFADEVPAVLAENRVDARFRVPAETAPDNLVHVVVGAVRVSDESGAVPDGIAEQLSLSYRERVNRFAIVDKRVRHVPVRNGILRADRVRDVGVNADRIPRGDLRSQHRHADTDTRSVYDASEPGGLPLQGREKLVKPFA